MGEGATGALRPSALPEELPPESLPARLGEVTLALRERGLDGWLLYDHRGQNPIAHRALGLGRRAPTTRFFYWIPSDGMPALVAHAQEIEGFPELPGDRLVWGSFAELRARLERVLPRRARVAMEHASIAGCPDLARVDAGTLELVRTSGAEVVSSAELVNTLLGPWSARTAALARDGRAAASAVLGEAREVLEASPDLTEVALRAVVTRACAARGLEGPLPLVATGAHTTRRLHGHAAADDRAIAPGDLVVIELCARLAEGPFVHAALVGARGDASPAARAAYARAVSARDAALEALEGRFARGTRTLGYEIDRVVRAELERGRDGVAARHRAGHHLGAVPWSAEACTFDDTEIHDPREALVGMAWSLHPGVYTAELGVRALASVRRGPSGLELLDASPRELVALGR